MDASQGKPDNSMRVVADVISDPRKRKAFARDPEQTLVDAGVDVGTLPEGVWMALVDLSYEEVRAVSRVKASLLDAGVSREDMAEIF